MQKEIARITLPRQFALAALLPASAWAHVPTPVSSASMLEPWLAGLLFASGALYALGLARLWRRAGFGRGISLAQAVRFASGWVVLAVALHTPIDTLGSRLFWMHMVQHELLMVVAAPLLVLGRPLEAWAWAVPPSARHSLVAFARSRLLRALWNPLLTPGGAFALHAAALWAWHVPPFFEAAIRHEGLHALQHVSFLGSALLFWWTVFGRGVKTPDTASVASLFGTMMHTGALGALLTFAPTAWYGVYGAGAFGLTAVEDQQLGGLVMWMPGSLAYLVAGLAVVGRWLRSEAPAEAR